MLFLSPKNPSDSLDSSVTLSPLPESGGWSMLLQLDRCPVHWADLVDILAWLVHRLSTMVSYKVLSSPHSYFPFCKTATNFVFTCCVWVCGRCRFWTWGLQTLCQPNSSWRLVDILDCSFFRSLNSNLSTRHNILLSLMPRQSSKNTSGRLSVSNECIPCRPQPSILES